MRRIILFIIPVLLVAIIVFGIIQIFFLGESGKGALQITTHPLSKVYLDNTYLGNTPLCRCEAATMIKSGNHTLRLVPLESNIPEFQEQITITKGVLTVVDRKFGKGAASEGSIISLTPLLDKTSTELLVITIPNASDVFVDASQKGVTPLSIKNLTDSDHSLLIKHDGYADKNVRIRTPAGYKLVATIYLGLKDGVRPTTTSPVASPSAAITPTQPATTGLPTRTTPSPTQIKSAGNVTILQTPNGFLRVRQSASLSSAEIARVLTGDTYRMIDEQNGWYKIRLEDGSEGWISSQYASKE